MSLCLFFFFLPIPRSTIDKLKLKLSVEVNISRSSTRHRCGPRNFWNLFSLLTGMSLFLHGSLRSQIALFKAGIGRSNVMPGV